MQNAIDSASDGATIHFAEGSYNWSNRIRLKDNRGVTLQGAGESSTIVSVTSDIIYLFNGITDNTRLFRITGFTFRNGQGNLLRFDGNRAAHKLRIDHNTFSNFGDDNIVYMGGSPRARFAGVIDNNKFLGSTSYGMILYLGPGDPDDSWTSSLKGSEHNVFIEDNVVDFN